MPPLKLLRPPMAGLHRLMQQRLALGLWMPATAIRCLVLDAESGSHPPARLRLPRVSLAAEMPTGAQHGLALPVVRLLLLRRRATATRRLRALRFRALQFRALQFRALQFRALQFRALLAAAATLLLGSRVATLKPKPGC